MRKYDIRGIISDFFSVIFSGGGFLVFVNMIKNDSKSSHSLSQISNQPWFLPLALIFCAIFFIISVRSLYRQFKYPFRD